MCAHHESLAVALRLQGSLDDGLRGGGAETFFLPAGIDREVP